MTILETHIVPEKVSGVRLSDYVIGIFEIIPTRKGMKKAIKKGAVCINGIVANTGRWVETGQIIQLIEVEEAPLTVYRMSLEVVYEDQEVALINKPAGIVVSGNYFKTIQNALPYNLAISTRKDSLVSPLPVHRLDFSTSGLLVVAKTRQARRKLGEQFEQKQIQKQYQAVVIGKPSNKGSIQQPIKGKPSITNYQVITTVPSLKNKYLSLLKVNPISGRTHQIRIHLSELGFPILGDKLYGNEGMILKGKGLFLSAVRLQFIHPTTEKIMDFSISAPLKFQTYMEREKRRWERYY